MRGGGEALCETPFWGIETRVPMAIGYGNRRGNTCDYEMLTAPSRLKHGFESRWGHQGNFVDV